MTAPATDPNRVIVTGENPFIRLGETKDGPVTTDASFWRVRFSPVGPGHVLYLKSELTASQWRIYADNIALARWLQRTVQGSLNKETADTEIPVVDATFRDNTGDVSSFWTEVVSTRESEVRLTWYEMLEPLLVHTSPGEERAYGVATVLVPALAARLTLDGVHAKGRPFPKDRDGRPYSTCALAFSESWTEPRSPAS